MSATDHAIAWSGVDVKVADVERKLSELRLGEDEESDLRTSVLTHLAWVPQEWEEAALDALAGLGPRHPSRAIVFLPQPDAEDGIDADVALECYAYPGLEKQICAEVITLRLRGRRALVPASIGQPLLVSDLPVFLRWRGQPPFGKEPFEQLVDLVDRLIVDSTEWPDLPQAYGELARIFDRVAASDIAWARTSRWRTELASLWPEIEKVKQIRVKGTNAQAHLLAGWLRSRLGRKIELEHEPSDRLVGVDVDGAPAPFPPGDSPHPSDLLSDELDTFDRDRVYEAAATAAED
jgi:hypothetical protein